jgi:hypothetical protein
MAVSHSQAILNEPPSKRLHKEKIMKLKTLLAITLILIAAVAAGQSYHSWQKFSSQIVTNAYGIQVLQCTWKCGTYDHGGHMTVTQGHGTSFCPIPN